MKKIVLTAAIALMSVSAFANFSKASLVSLNRSNIVNTSVQSLASDSVSAEQSKAEMPEMKLSRVAFYDVDHIVITNTRKQYIRIEDQYGQTVIESCEDIDIKLRGGNYYVYTDASHLIALYR